MELPYAVYILKCNDAPYYTGSATNIQNRLKAHRIKGVHYTKDKLPVELIYLSMFLNKQKRL